MNTETVSAPKEKVIALYNKPDQGGRAALIELFGPRMFFTDIPAWEKYIIPRINSFEDACQELGLDPADHQFLDRDPDDRAYAQGKIIVKALNGPFSLSWNNRNQPKYHGWMEKTATGFRLDVVDFGYDYTATTSGARLRLCSENLGRHFAEKFEPLIRPFMDFE